MAQKAVGVTGNWRNLFTSEAASTGIRFSVNVFSERVSPSFTNTSDNN